MDALRFLAAASTVLVTWSCVPVVPPAPSRPPAAASPGGRVGANEARIFNLINAERRRQGLVPLEYSRQLDEMAKIQARNMAYFHKMAHVLPESGTPTLADRARHVGYSFGRLAENVAHDYPSAQSVVQGWMTSKGHRANILNSDVVETGIAIARSSSGGLYYCQVFGRRLSSL
ncbi:MAG TPA: CAP domain-containing protein [Gemmatimonadaceae bacterium]|nr:CAP domain-containing protein [Gemmatimonadaceae bacterium]